ncbi:MAG: DUF2059 domain-containing protein [Burkholderiales bacterium]|nr:DUF2059 domain-containing protein [Burkholderiales bacterium]
MNSVKNIKLALLLAALVTSSLAVAQDGKAALVKQFVQLQRPQIEALARSLVEQSSAPISQAGTQYLQTQVPPEKRAAAAKAADAVLKNYFDSSFPIVRDKAVQIAPAALGPILEQNFSEDELRQLVAWINSPLAKKYATVAPQMQKALGEMLVAQTRDTIEPKLSQVGPAVAKALGAPPPAAAPAAAAPASK